MNPPLPKKPITTQAPKPPVSGAVSKIQFGKIGNSTSGHRVVLYGTGGIGKSTLACCAPGRVAYNDAEDSLEILKPKLLAAEIELPVLIPGRNYKELRASLHAEGWDAVKSIVVEITRIEEWCVAHTLATVPNDKGQLVKSIEGYGYGKGYRHVFDTFLFLLQDFDRHVRAGRNVILIAHECKEKVPNPEGDDWLRYEPRLQNSEKANIRHRVKEWADHVLFYAYDVLAEDGKAKGSGTRTIYTGELPHCMAKSRTSDGLPIAVSDVKSVWPQIIP